MLGTTYHSFDLAPEHVILTLVEEVDESERTVACPRAHRVLSRLCFRFHRRDGVHEQSLPT